MDEFFTVKEIAKVLKLKEETIRKKIRAGEIKALKSKRKFLISKKELNRVLEQFER